MYPVLLQQKFITHLQDTPGALYTFRPRACSARPYILTETHRDVKLYEAREIEISSVYLQYRPANHFNHWLFFYIWLTSNRHIGNYCTVTRHELHLFLSFLYFALDFLQVVGPNVHYQRFISYIVYIVEKNTHWFGLISHCKHKMTRL